MFKTLVGGVIVLCLLMALSIPSHAGDAIAVKDGEYVITTTTGELYIAKDILVYKSLVIISGVRHPEKMEELAFPVTRLHSVYKKGWPSIKD